MGEILRVGDEGLDALKAFLVRDPIQNLFALSVIEEYGLGRAEAPRFAFHTASDAGQIKAAIFVGGEGELYVPIVDAAAAGVIGRHLAESGLPMRSALRSTRCSRPSAP